MRHLIISDRDVLPLLLFSGSLAVNDSHLGASQMTHSLRDDTLDGDDQLLVRMQFTVRDVLPLLLFSGSLTFNDSHLGASQITHSIRVDILDVGRDDQRSFGCSSQSVYIEMFSR
jgi:hypothetical protein